MKKIRIRKKAKQIIISPFDKLVNLRKEYRNAETKSLRSNFTHISVSKIANQFYCEMQLEMMKKYGRIETRKMRIGSIQHEEIASLAVEKSLAGIKKRINTGETVRLVETLLFMKYKGIFILGAPDCITFVRRKPKYIIERKFSNNLQFNQSQHIQANLYCLLLDELGFNTKNMYYVIVISTSVCRDCFILDEHRICNFAIKKGGIIRKKDICHSCSEGRIVLQAQKYDRGRIISDLEWALEYWLKKRKAIPTKLQRKCRLCNYEEKCPSSLMR